MTTATAVNLIGKTLKGHGKLTWTISKREVRTNYIASRGKPAADCYFIVPSDPVLPSDWISVEQLERDIDLGRTKFAK